MQTSNEINNKEEASISVHQPFIFHQSEEILVRKLNKNRKSFLLINVMQFNPYVKENVNWDLLVLRKRTQVQETLPYFLRQHIYA